MIDISKEVDVFETVFELRNVQSEILNDIVSETTLCILVFHSDMKSKTLVSIKT